MQLVALLRLGFPSAPYLKYLTLLHIVTRWLVLQKAHHRTHKVLWSVVDIWFQVLFHSPPGVLFAFPSRYWFTIGRLRVFSLGGWSPHLQTGFLVSRPTCRKPSPVRWISCTGLSPCFVILSRMFHYLISLSLAGSSHFARHYFGNLGWFLFL